MAANWQTFFLIFTFSFRLFVLSMDSLATAEPHWTELGVHAIGFIICVSIRLKNVVQMDFAIAIGGNAVPTAAVRHEIGCEIGRIVRLGDWAAHSKVILLISILIILLLFLVVSIGESQQLLITVNHHFWLGPVNQRTRFIVFGKFNWKSNEIIKIISRRSAFSCSFPYKFHQRRQRSNR